ESRAKVDIVPFYSTSCSPIRPGINIQLSIGSSDLPEKVSTIFKKIRVFSPLFWLISRYYFSAPEEAYIILKLDAVFSPLFQPVFDKNPEFCQKKKSAKK
ncbi:MAG: hypothetical protein II382_07670, partial [Oscillospiraceae bacterium]|nr:hypothetical protein [Oscillospiraceae bacterium]